MEFRDECYRCHKAAVVCVCETVPKVRNRTGLVILQHPRERFHPIGTLRFAKLGLENVRVVVVDRSAEEVELPPQTGLLYPSPDARVLSEVPPEERPSSLLIIDGTWAQARKVYRQKPWLARLPHFAIAPKEKGNYRIRLEPDDRSLSTIEAIVEALALLEPDTEGLSGLIGAFSRMIDTQIEYTKTPHGRFRRPRKVEPRAIPQVLLEQPERVVLGYGEFAFPPEGPRLGKYMLVYWCGMRLATGETFETYVRPARYSEEIPGDRQLRFMGLPREPIAAGCSSEEFARKWSAFVGEDGVVATWNKSTIDFLRADTGFAGEMYALKAAYCNSRQRASGSLEEVMRAESLEKEAMPFPGRPGRVMSALLPLTRVLR